MLPIECLRPPYGATDARTAAFAGELGKRNHVVEASIRRTGGSRGADQIVSHVLENVGPGSVVLMHDGGGDRDQTVAALDAVLGGADGAGLPLRRRVPLSGYQSPPRPGGT